MKLLFLGDIFGNPGREAVKKFLKEHKSMADIVIANGENMTHGHGISAKYVNEMFAAGIDVITTGNHVWDQEGTPALLEKNPRVLRPLNFDDKAPGQGFYVLESQGLRCLIVNIQGRVFMPQQINNPFAAMDDVLSRHGLKRTVDAIFVDFHAEITAEKQAMAYYLDGRVSAVIGTHTHVPTADNRILPKGTAYQTDAGMCGDYNSVIGNSVAAALKRLTKPYEKSRLEPANGKGEVKGVLITVSHQTGLAQSIERIG